MRPAHRLRPRTASIQGMTLRRFANILPLLAVLGSVTALGIGTSFAKQLFPLVGSLGTTALRVGFCAVSLDPEGVMYALAAAVCWGAYIVFGKRVGHLHAGHSVALGLTVAAITVVPFGIWHAGSALLDPHILLFGLGVAAISSAIPISLEMMALKRLPQQAFGIMTSMEPAVAALLGLLMLGEHLTGLQWVAVVCIMMAAIGSSMTARRDTPKSAPAEVVM